MKPESVKNAVKLILQRLVGFETYLYSFAWYKVRTLRRDKQERDFFHFLELLPDDGIVLDVGANIGIMTVHLARQAKRGRVIAFEPVPDNFNTLKRVITRFKLTNVTLERYALGDHEGSVEMVVPVERGVKQQGLSHVLHESITERNEGQRLTVPLRKLDSFSFAREPTPRVTGIKIDVENFESFVLEGAKELLRQHKPLMYVELWHNENRRRCFEIVRALGYEVYVSEGQELRRFDPALHGKRNFVFR